MHSSLSVIKETAKEGGNDSGSSQHLMRLFHTLGPSVHAGPPLRPPTIYPASWFRPAPDAHHSWQKPPSEDTPIRYRTRVNLVGARIPQELFDYILEHMRPNVSTYRKMKKTEMPLSPWRDPISEEGWRTCTQVCRHWANKCRRYIFGGAVLMISSSDEMDEILEYAFHGCPLLIPLHKIIKGIHVVQVYDATRSFFHLLQILKKADVPVQILDLRLLLPPRIPSVQIPSKTPCPRWSIPPKVATPPSLLSGCCAVTVKSIHVRSFPQVLQLIRHFALVPMKSWEIENRGSVRYDRLTWNNHCIHDSPVYRKPVLCRRAYIPNCVHIEATDCTDNVRLCMYTAVARPSFAMHWMQEDERRWMFSLVVSFDQFLDLPVEAARKCALHSNFLNFEDHQWPRISWLLGVSPHAIHTLEVSFYLDRLPQDAPAFNVRVVGLEVVVPWEFGPGEPSCAIAFSALLAIVRSCPMRLIINFCFIGWSLEDLQGYLELYLPFNWNLQTEAHTVIFTALMLRLSELWWERIDPVTLSPTGQRWQDRKDIIPSLVIEQSQDEHHVL